MSITPINKKRIYEEIVAQIEKMIIDGEYKPGDKLPTEDELASKFSVSKTVIREAMSVLKANGLVVSRPGSGNYIRKSTGAGFVTHLTSILLLNEESVKEMVALRRGLEIEAAAIAAEQATEHDIESLIDIHKQLKMAINVSIEEAVEKDYEFHKMVFTATHNTIFIKVFNSVFSKIIKQVITLSKKQSSEHNPKRHMEGIREHEEIIKAIKTKDKVEARAAMLTHLQNNEKKTWKLDDKGE